jgi:hypothetical protein
MECGGGELATSSWRTAIASTSWRRGIEPRAVVLNEKNQRDLISISGCLLHTQVFHTYRTLKQPIVQTN